MRCAPPSGVLHLATRVPPPEARGERESWIENDRLRGECTPILARAAMDASASLFLMPTVAFVYPPGPADESTPIRDDLPYYLETAGRRRARWSLASPARVAAGSFSGSGCCTGLVPAPMVPTTPSGARSRSATPPGRSWPP